MKKHIIPILILTAAVLAVIACPAQERRDNPADPGATNYSEDSSQSISTSTSSASSSTSSATSSSSSSSTGLFDPSTLPNLEAMWEFDNSLTDYQLTHDLYYLNGTATYVPGKVGQALVLTNHNDDHFVSNGTMNPGFTGPKMVTIAFWVRAIADGYGPLFNWNTASQQNLLIWTDANDWLYFSLALAEAPATASVKMNDYQWYHVTAVWSNSYHYLYTNSVLAGTNYNANPNPSLQTGFKLASSYGLINYSGILVDDLMIFYSSLTPANIQDIYSRGAP